MMCRILPCSRAIPRPFVFQLTDMTAHFRILGAWELPLDSSCAREEMGYCIHRIFARVLKLFLPILPKKVKRGEKQELMTLDCLEARGSVGGWA